jgi:hypothetical protein
MGYIFENSYPYPSFSNTFLEPHSNEIKRKGQKKRKTESLSPRSRLILKSLGYKLK